MAKCGVEGEGGNFKYDFDNPEEEKQTKMKSWKMTSYGYEGMKKRVEGTLAKINEENPWLKDLDGWIGEDGKLYHESGEDREFPMKALEKSLDRTLPDITEVRTSKGSSFLDKEQKKNILRNMIVKDKVIEIK